jgi:hypothetical protein
MATTETKGSKRVVGVLSAIYFSPEKDVTDKPVLRVKTALRGDVIDLSPAEENRLEENGALLPKGSKPEDAAKAAEARLDAYRAQRGDQEALARHHERLVASKPGDGEIVNVEAPVDGNVGELTEWIKQSKPNVDDTVALAEGDPEKAQRILDAEVAATGGSPRKSVQEQLEKIVAG